MFDLGYRDLLPRCQFFECSALATLAAHMVNEDLLAIEGAGRPGVFSENAQLPAPLCAIEYLGRAPVDAGVRYLFLCEYESPGVVRWVRCLGAFGYLRIVNSNTFTLGESTTGGGWVVPMPHEDPSMPEWDAEQRAVALCNGVMLEKLLMLINTPNLVERVRRPTDKRIVREASRAGGPIGDFMHWSECKIRGGVHRRAGSSDEGVAERPLHYVRKYYKPSSAKWVDGYWRGNADIGVHLKVYSPQPPAAQVSF